MEHLKYPIGRFDKTRIFSIDDRESALNYLAGFPDILEAELKALNNSDLLKVYRPDGWNIRQLVHHLADSHTNLYVRIKIALTEENPPVKGYEEDLWAELPDYEMDLSLSLGMLRFLHAKIVYILRSMPLEGFERTYYHPQYKETYVLKNVIHLYKWHSEHHLEHIRIAKTN